MINLPMNPINGPKVFDPIFKHPSYRMDTQGQAFDVADFRQQAIYKTDIRGNVFAASDYKFSRPIGSVDENGNITIT